MRQLSLALLLLLAACAPPPRPVPSYRNTEVRIATPVAFDAARLTGSWHEIAGFYDPATSGCAVGLTQVAALPKGVLHFTIGECAGLGVQTVNASQGKLPGRFSLPLKGRLGEPWWVLWTDEDYRVLVIGTPSGHFGAILSRTPQLRRDLSEAAKRILDFNGYDLSQLRQDMR